MIDKIVTVNKEKGFVVYNVVSLKDFEAVYDNKAISFDLLKDSFRKLIGRTLTIIDASTSGPQNKAMKDLVRNAFSEEIGFVSELVFDTKSIQEDCNKAAEGMSMEDLENHSITVEEMLEA